MQVFKLRLVSYSIDYDDLDSISVTFSDVKKGQNGMGDSDDIVQRAESLATSYNSVVSVG